MRPSLIRLPLATALCLGLLAAPSPAEITSSEFSFGYDYNANNTWSLTGTLPTTQGDFSFAPAVSPNPMFSEWGPSFADGILANGTQSGLTGYSGRSSDFAVAIDAAYSGAGTVAEITLEISEIRIYAASYTTLQGDNQIQWVETTPGVTASSPEFDLTVCGSTAALTQAANYTDVTWDPDDTAVAGAATTTRTFGFAADNNRALEGLEVTGVVKVRLDGSEDPITSGAFSFAYDCIMSGVWSPVKLTLPTTTVGDFTFTPTVTPGNNAFSTWGPVFVGGILGNGKPYNTTSPQGYQCDRTDGFAVSIDAGYTGAAPASAIKLEITGLRIHATAYTTQQGNNLIHWIETTPGVTASSTEVGPLQVCAVLNDLTLAAQYTEVPWDPDDFWATGASTTRSFALVADPANPTFSRAIDGLEIFGRITVDAEGLALKIARSGGNLDFEWNSRAGKQYDLLSATSLNTPPETWSVYQSHEDIPADESGANILTGVTPDGAVRFFALREEDPVP